MRIRPVSSAADLAAVVALFRAYASGLGIDLAFQGFEAELAAMPGEYAPPAGRLLLALDRDGMPLGCVALRPIAPAGHCEMKRLYVSPEGRGRGVGKALVDAILQEAVSIGYREMRLDTLAGMASALALYRRAGFTQVPAYRNYASPPTDMIFLGRSLKPMGSPCNQRLPGSSAALR